MGLLKSDVEAVVIQLDKVCHLTISACMMLRKIFLKVGQPFVAGDVVTGSVLVCCVYFF